MEVEFASDLASALDASSAPARAAAGEDVFEAVRGGSDAKAAVLAALEEAVVEERGGGGAPSASEVFAAIMTALDAARGSHRAELLALLALAAPAASATLLRGKFDMIAAILGALVARTEAPPQGKRGADAAADGDADGAGVARRALQCLAVVLARQEPTEATWAAPARLRCLDGLLRCAGDRRPKVRKAARAAVVDVVRATGVDGVAARVARWCGALLAKVGDRAGDIEAPAAAFHLVLLVAEAAPACAPKHRAALAEALVKHALGRAAPEQAPQRVKENAWQFEALALRAVAACGAAAAAAAALLAVRPSTLEASGDVAGAWCDAVAAAAAAGAWPARDADVVAQRLAAVAANNSAVAAKLPLEALAVLAPRCSAAALAAVALALVAEANGKRNKNGGVVEPFRDAVCAALAAIVGAAGSDAAAEQLLRALAAAVEDKAYAPVFDAAIRRLGVRAVLGAVAFGPANAAAVVSLLKKRHAAARDGGEALHGLFLDDFLRGMLPVAAAEPLVWGAAPLFCAGAADLEAHVLTLAPKLAELLQSDDVAARRVACECCAALRPQNGQAAGAAVAQAARGVLPALFAATMERAEVADDDSFEHVAVEAVAALAVCADKAFVDAVFKKLVQRLLATVADGRASVKASRKRGADEAADGVEAAAQSSMKKAAALCATAAALVPALDAKALDVLWRAARPLVADDRADVAVQKRAYKLVLALCSEPARERWLLSPAHSGLAKVLTSLTDGSLQSCHVACRERRLRVLCGLIGAADASAADAVALVVVPLVGEVVLCLKDANAKARAAAFATLDAMAVLCAMHAAQHGGGSELPKILVGALGARTPHMRSAAMVALSRVCFEHRAALAPQLPPLLETALLLLRDKAREVAKATVAFVHVAVLALCAGAKGGGPDMLEPLLPQLIDGLMLWAHEKKARFRAKIKLVLRKLCRAYSHEAIVKLVPPSDVPLIQHLKRAEVRAAAKKKNRKDAAAGAALTDLLKVPARPAAAEDDDDGEDALFRDDFDDEDVGDSSDDEPDGDAKARKAPAPRAQQSRQQDLAAKRQRRLEEKDGEVIDLLAKSDRDDGGGGDDDDDDEMDGGNITIDGDGRIVVGAERPVAPAAAPAKQGRFHAGKGGKGKGKDKKGQGKKKTGGDVFRAGSLAPYSWAPLGDIARKKARKA
ncbi:armadillo-type protein [Pelagophyceae sp. CCMP2097]|nr:armadillo-type protein [Pelagophyceae sp. CCMP2097]